MTRSFACCLTPAGGEEARGVLLAAQKSVPRGRPAGAHAPQSQTGVCSPDPQGTVKRATKELALH